jgi:guanylate kinase
MYRSLVVVLDGVAGVGKSELLGYARKHSSRLYYVPTKLTTRPPRSTDNSWEFSFVADVPETPELVVWTSLGRMYAVQVEALRNASSIGRTPILVCTESAGIAALRRYFDTIHIYVFRPLARDALLRILEQRHTQADQIDKRLIEHASLAEDYVEKLPTITATLLNIGDQVLLHRQFDSVMSHIREMRQRMGAMCDSG